MDYKISLQEMNLKGKQILLKQPKTTYEKALQQAKELKMQSLQGQKKKGH